MKLFKKFTSKDLLCLLFLMIFLFSVSLTAAHNKVAVIPLFDDQSGAPSAIAKTGQTATYATGDDGNLQMGVSWPNPRFTDNGDGTVKDNLTGLIWLKNANCTSFFSGDSTGQNSREWHNSLTAANSLASSYCGLTDGSSAGAWRLPNIRELDSLIDFSNYHPALRFGHPFTGVSLGFYWSSTTFANQTHTAWVVYMNLGYMDYTDKVITYSVWPVRGGND